MASKFLLVFIDGIGMGKRDEQNPFCFATMPTVQGLLGGALVENVSVIETNLLCKAIDATLDTPGVPQSATGQTALFTGVNAAHSLGYHLPAYPNASLIELIKKYSIFKKATDGCFSACFANAYRNDYFKIPDIQFSVTTHCVIAAGLPFLFVSDLLAGRAVYWDITNEYLHQQDESVPTISAYQAGHNLANISSNHSVTVFECFESDLIGHRMDKDRAVVFLEKLDAFLCGLVDNIPPDVTIILTSDHGNIEDLSHGAHTFNPVPLLVKGAKSNIFHTVKSILDITPTILAELRENH